MSTRIFDCFLFRDEFDLLELRLRYLWHYVDRFVVIHGSHSFQGETLPNPLDPLPPRLAPFSQKLHSYRVELPVVQEKDPWKLERTQRNASLMALSEAGVLNSDVVILSDVDEIWFRSIHDQLLRLGERNTSPSARLSILMWDSYFFSNVVRDSPWCPVFALPWSEFSQIDPFAIRTAPVERRVEGLAGWHLTYAGGVEAILRKQRTFAHTEFQNTKYITRDWIENCIASLSDPYERDIQWRIMPYAELERCMEPGLLELLLRSYPQFHYQTEKILASELQ